MSDLMIDGGELVEQLDRPVIDVDGLQWGMVHGCDLPIVRGVRAVPDVTRSVQEGRTLINCNVRPTKPTWINARGSNMKHFFCGMVDPTKISVRNVLNHGEDRLAAKEFLERARRLRGAMNACAFDFYSKSDNWKYLPREAHLIVFPNTVFRGFDREFYVPYLYQYGVKWVRQFFHLKRMFDSSCLVAALADEVTD